MGPVGQSDPPFVLLGKISLTSYSNPRKIYQGVRSPSVPSADSTFSPRPPPSCRPRWECLKVCQDGKGWSEVLDQG